MFNFVFQFKKEPHLEYHQSICIVEAQCSKCHKTFVRKKSTVCVFRRQIKRHEKLCKGPKKPNQCPKCGKVFKRRYNLKTHMETTKNCGSNPQWDNEDVYDDDDEESDDDLEQDVTEIEEWGRE